jgi:hypothetical protein
MELEFNGQYDQPTYFKAVSLVYRPSRRSLLTRIFVFILFGAMYAVLIAGNSQEVTRSTLEVARLFRHLLTLLLLGYLVFQPYITAYRTAARLWKDPVVRRRLAGRISSLGIQYAPSQEWIGWADFIKVHKTPGLVVLLTAARNFVALPRTFFGSDQDWVILNQMIDSRVQEAV